MYITWPETGLKKQNVDHLFAAACTSLNAMRGGGAKDFLNLLMQAADRVYKYGMLIAADPLVCAEALTIAARTGAFAITQGCISGGTLELGSGLLATKDIVLHAEKPSYALWVNTVYQGIIARERDCVTELLKMSNSALSSPTEQAGDNEAFCLVDLARALAEGATSAAFAKAYCDYAIRGVRPKEVRSIARRQILAFLSVVDALSTADSIRFNNSLAEEIQCRRERWLAVRRAYEDTPASSPHVMASTLLPLPLIATVVLAFDR